MKRIPKSSETPLEIAFEQAEVLTRLPVTASIIDALRARHAGLKDEPLCGAVREAALLAAAGPIPALVYPELLEEKARELVERIRTFAE